jgi:hypothetical protein
MNAAALLLAAASLSVDYGWRKAEDGAIEYIIQVAPEQVGNLERLPISSELPPEARGASRFVFQVGDKPLPREAIEPDKLASEKPANEKQAPEKETTDDDEPIVRGQSVADPYSQPASNQRYQGLQAGKSRVGGQATAASPRVASQPRFVPQGAAAQPAQRPFNAFNAQPPDSVNYAPANPPDFSGHSAANSGAMVGVARGIDRGIDRGDANYGAQFDDPQPARGVWRGEADPTLDLPDRTSSLDSDLAAADRAYREGAAPRVAFSSGTAATRGAGSQTRTVAHDEELDERPASRRRDWPDSEADEEKSSRGAPSPWTITMMLLFASVGGNVWLGYLVWDLTQRFRDVVSDNRRRRRQSDAVDGANL